MANDKESEKIHDFIKSFSEMSSEEQIQLIAQINSNPLSEKKVTIDDWTDFLAMLNDMKGHALANGQSIVEEDRPMQLRWAWRCTNTGKTWSIKISNLRKCINTLDAQGDTSKADILRRMSRTQDGKQNLLDVINGRSL